MAIRSCRVLGIEGAHGTGKSTLAQALAAHYKERHIHVGTLWECARTSPFVEEVVVHGKGEFDMSAELDLLGAQIVQEQRLARHHELLICDRTVTNILGYARLLLSASESSWEAEVLDAMETFCRAYVKQYDLVVFVSDFFDLSLTKDPFRPRDPAFQRAADQGIRNACRDLGLRTLDLQPGLAMQEKVRQVVAEIHL